MAGDRQLRCEAAFGLADDILRAIRAATSWPALRTVARDVTDAMGFRYFALITHEDLRAPRSGAVDLRDYAEGAVRRIIAECGYLRDPIMRSEERRVGRECVKTCRSWCTPVISKTK